MSEIVNSKKVAQNGLSKLLNAANACCTVSEVELLPHNQILYNNIVVEMEKGEYNIFFSEATGLGKSFIFMRLVQDYFVGKKILYIVPKISIWKNLTRYKEFKTLNANIVMTTYAAFNKYDSSLCDEYDVVFVDECHHMLSEIQGNNVYKFCKDMSAINKYSFGFTATPYYKGTYVDEACFDVSCYGYDICESIDLEILPKIHFSVANIDIDSIPADMRARYSITGTKTLLEQLLERNADKSRWIAYFLNKAELEQNAYELENLFPGYTILKVYDGIEDEDAIYDTFNESTGKVILLSVNKLLEGVHLKNVQGVLLYRNVTEFSTYMQMYGRLCDISAEESPVFIDVANAIFSINKVSEKNIFKSNRCGGRPKRKLRDFFDVHADDYWTVELMDVIMQTSSSNDATWTDEEDNILFEYYPTMGCDVQELLSNRSRSAIAKRVYKLGIKYENLTRYAEWEDDIIRKEFSRYGRTICNKLNDRSPASVAQRARVLGVVYLGEKPLLDEEMELFIKRRAEGATLANIMNELNKLQCNIERGVVRDSVYMQYMAKKSGTRALSEYTEEELAVLMKYVNEPTRHYICSRLLNRKVNPLSQKFKRYYNPAIPYTIKELTFIRDNMNILSLESLTESLNKISVCERTKEGIQDHINVLNGVFKYAMEWTDEEIQLLYKEYPDKGIEYIQSVLFYRPYYGIISKLSELNIKRKTYVQPKSYDFMFSTEPYRGVDISSRKSLAEFSGRSIDGVSNTLRNNNWTASQFVDYILDNTYKGYHRTTWISSLVKDGYPEDIIKRLSQRKSMKEVIDIMLSGDYKHMIDIAEYRGILLRSPRAVSLQLGIATSCWDKYKRNSGDESIEGFAKYWYNRVLELGRFKDEDELRKFIEDRRKEFNI